MADQHGWRLAEAPRRSLIWTKGRRLLCAARRVGEPLFERWPISGVDAKTANCVVKRHVIQGPWQAQKCDDTPTSHEVVPRTFECEQVSAIDRDDDCRSILGIIGKGQDALQEGSGGNREVHHRSG